MRSHFLVVVALAGVLQACGASSLKRHFGNRATYDHQRRAYVLRGDSFNPPVTTRVVVLVDPVSGRKMRCGEQVRAWLATLRHTFVDELHDEQLAVPIKALVAGGAQVMWIAAPFVAPYAIGRSKTWRAHWRLGTDKLAAGDQEGAMRMLERALAKGGETARRQSTVLFDLAGVYEQLGHPRRAAAAYEAFYFRATIPAAAKYDRSERRLKALRPNTPGLAPCIDQRPVVIDWRKKGT